MNSEGVVVKKLGALVSTFPAYPREKDIAPALIIEGLGAEQSHFSHYSNQIR
ncbi:hypothetical protein ACFL1G_06870 [Planctomycetota bacterium]